MDQQLKTRLIGVTIIVSLVVIFVPMLFEDSSDVEGGDVNSVSAPEFPQEFDSQALPLPSTAPGVSAVAPEPLPVPARDEPLDPLDVSVAGSGPTDEMGGMEPRDVGADIQASPRMGKASHPAELSRPTLKEAPARANMAAESPLAEKPKTTSASPVPPVAKSKKDVPAKKAAALPAKLSEVAKKDSASKMSAWVVQAGSFSDETNAKTLMFKLRQVKISAFVERVPGPSGNSYRVRVGPELERAHAEAILKKMDSEVGVKGMIVSYP